MNLKQGKIKFIIIAVAIVIAIVVATVFILMPKDEEITSGNEKNPIEEKEKSPSEKIKVDTITYIDNKEKSEININRPSIDNLSNNTFEQYINNQMSKTTQYYQKEINVVLDENTPDTTNYRYKVDYERYNNEDYLSLVINQSYQTGGMRSNAWKDTYNIDVVKNTEIYLKDLFASTVDYEKEIVDEINEQAMLKNYELVGGNGLKDIPEKQKFYIKDGKLIIYFDPAAIAPYVYGSLNFEMPFKLEAGKFIVE